MIKSNAKKPSSSRIGGSLGGKSGDLDEIEEKLKNKQLPENVR